MEACPKCNKGKLKHTKAEYTLKTRHSERRSLHFENLPMKECTVCDYSEVQQKGEEMIESVKSIIKQEMQKTANLEKEKISGNKSSLMEVVRKFIG